MKTKFFFFLICNLLICNLQFSQNIANTLGTSGTFTIKDGSTTFLTLTQSNGTISLISPIAGYQRGSIFKGANRFLHTYYGSGTDGQNTFLGMNAGNFTMGGSYYEGSYNTGIGNYSLYSNTTGFSNSAFGNSSLYHNTTGYYNSAFGNSSLYHNTTGYNNSAFGNSSLYSNTTGYNNSAFGFYSLYYNTTGIQNSAFGLQSLYRNTTGYKNSAFGENSLKYNTAGYQNSAFGTQSLYSNTMGSDNSAFGFYSLYYNTTGIQNSAFGNGSLYSNTEGYNNYAFGLASLYSNTTGYQNSAFGYSSLYSNTMGNNNSAFGNYSLYNNTTGNYNTAYGYYSGVSITTGGNNTAIGNNAQVPSGTSSNQVRIGNTSITYAGIQVAWTITSDRNLKSNIFSSNLGLGFISKLNPVSYTRKNDESAKTEYGLIAQEVEEVLLQEGAVNTGMLTVTDEGEYQLRYNDLIAPMIKAIQELKSENDELKKKIESLETVEDRLTKLEMYINEQNKIKEVNSKINTVNQ